MNNDFDPFRVLATCFSISSFAGLAAVLRSGKKLTTRSVLSATLNSGLLGLGIGFIYFQWAENIYILIGICALAGLGGITLLDFVVQALQGGGINVTIRVPHKDDNERDGETTDE
jgi:hypothetical protein